MPEIPLAELLDPELLNRVSSCTLLARRAVEGFIAGMHRSVCRGGGSEFVQYRPYHAGDDLKLLDWKLLGRSQKACCKVFQQETNMRLVLVLDTSASMGYCGSHSPCSKLRYAVMLAACLEHLARQQGDVTGIFTYTSSLDRGCPPGHGRGAVSKMLEELWQQPAAGRAAHGAAWLAIQPALPPRCLVLWISDLHEAEAEMAPVLRRLRFAGHTPVVCQILDQDERDLPFSVPLNYVDSESGSEVQTDAGRIRTDYQRRMARFQAEVRQCCLEHDTEFLEGCSRDNLGHLLTAWLRLRKGVF